jgi:hypothetical protein
MSFIWMRTFWICETQKKSGKHKQNYKLFLYKYLIKSLIRFKTKKPLSAVQPQINRKKKKIAEIQLDSKNKFLKDLKKKNPLLR